MRQLQSPNHWSKALSIDFFFLLYHCKSSLHQESYKHKNKNNDNTILGYIIPYTLGEFNNNVAAILKRKCVYAIVQSFKKVTMFTIIKTKQVETYK